MQPVPMDRPSARLARGARGRRMAPWAAAFDERPRAERHAQRRLHTLPRCSKHEGQASQLTTLDQLATYAPKSAWPPQSFLIEALLTLFKPMQKSIRGRLPTDGRVYGDHSVGSPTSIWHRLPPSRTPALAEAAIPSHWRM